MRQVTVKWYERTYEPPPDDYEGDWCDDGETSDEGERVFDAEDLDPEWPGEATFAQVIAKWLQDEGATEPSSSHWWWGNSAKRMGDKLGALVWWRTADMETNYRTGETSEKSYHIYGLKWWEEWVLWQYMKGRGLSGRTH